MADKSFDVYSVARKFPSFRDKSSKYKKWLSGKRHDDGAEGLWRIHDKLYDLINFIPKHPGGADWLESTQGTDITELFETHHIRSKTRLLLSNFYIREAKNPRNSRITFCDDGFYQTLKTKVAEYLTTVDKTALKRSSDMIVNCLLMATFSLTILSGIFNSFVMATLTGFSLGLLTCATHNYLHQRDSWRMYCFNLSGLNHREWRISHVISHHMFPNTCLDFEVFMFEPILQLFPTYKTDVQKITSMVLTPFCWMLLIKFSIYRRTIGYFTTKSHFKCDQMLTFVIPLTMHFCSKSTTVVETLELWLIVITTASFMIGFIGMTSGQHHPKVYHEGDELPSSMDYGIFQMNANIDRSCTDMKSNRFLNLTLFGYQTLHHLFPTLDHNLLPQLNELFMDTCNEFNIQVRELSFWASIVGLFEQLARVDINSMRKMRI